MIYFEETTQQLTPPHPHTPHPTPPRTQTQPRKIYLTPAPDSSLPSIMLSTEDSNCCIASAILLIKVIPFYQ